LDAFPGLLAYAFLATGIGQIGIDPNMLYR
jgi:hypothetical protein